MSPRLWAGWGCTALLILAASAAGAQPATTPAQPPLFSGPVLPEPPHQHDPWPRPTTTLPAALIDDTALLFDQGVADPRGGEYRAVAVVTGSCWGGAGVTDTHAWVPPAAPGATQRFAVCWNGLLYPCVTVGDKADLAADVRAMLDADRNARDEAARAKDKYDGPFRHSHGDEMAEAEPVAVRSLYPLRACLLLRLGETKLAESYWPAVVDDTRSFDSQQRRPDDPYLALSDGWARYAFDRALAAHMRGEDVVSRDTAKLLTTAMPKIKAIDAGKKLEWSHVDFFGELPDLLSDEARRTAEGPVRRVLDDPRGYPDQQRRIAALVRDLEVASAAPQWSSLADDPVAQALVREGEPAVDALIDCVANDARLTRMVWVNGDSGEWRHLFGTPSAAFEILEEILQTDHFGSGNILSVSGRPNPEVAEQIRAFHAKNKGKSPAEQWYETLADDAAGPDRWLDAAGRIVEPTDVDHRNGWVMSKVRQPGAPTRLKGEPLRGRRGPSVSELLAKRVSIIAAGHDGYWSASTHAVDVALDLYRWDAPAAVPVLREQLQRCMDARWPAGTERVDETARDVGRLTTALVAAGDAEGAHRYAAWVVRQGPATAGHNVGDLFQPIWRNPDNADLAAVAEALFNSPTSPWREVSAVPQFTDSGQPSLYASPMVGLAAFRRRVQRDLGDVSVIGSAQVTDRNLHVSIPYHDGSGGGIESYGGVNDADPLLPTTRDVKVPVRGCDWCAWKVSQLEGAPPFEPYWPLAKRDEQRAKLTEFLDRWGDRFRYSRRPVAIGELGDDAARITFPLRDAPATQDDVRRATAIFALAGGPVRVAPLPDWPIRARWVATPKRSTEAKAGVAQNGDDFLNEGLIWQAEEVQVGGKWQRFYGFVGPHTIAKVPAEQIEFAKDP